MSLAERTLELVDVPSESGREAELAALVAALVPLERRYAEGETLLYTTGRTASRCCSSPGTSTRFPRRATSPAGSAAAPCTASAPPT